MWTSECCCWWYLIFEINIDRGENNFQGFSNYTLMLRHLQEISQLAGGGKRATRIPSDIFEFVYLGCCNTINNSAITFNKSSSDLTDVFKTHCVIRDKDGSFRLPQSKRHRGNEIGSRKQSWIEMALANMSLYDVCVCVCLSPFVSGTVWSPAHTCSVLLCLVLPILLVLALRISACNCFPGLKSTLWLFSSVSKANLLRLWIFSVLNSKRAERGHLCFPPKHPCWRSQQAWEAIVGSYVHHQSNLRSLSQQGLGHEGRQLTTLRAWKWQNTTPVSGCRWGEQTQDDWWPLCFRQMGDSFFISIWKQFKGKKSSPLYFLVKRKKNS